MTRIALDIATTKTIRSTDLRLAVEDAVTEFDPGVVLEPGVVQLEVEDQTDDHALVVVEVVNVAYNADEAEQLATFLRIAAYDFFALDTLDPEAVKVEVLQ